MSKRKGLILGAAAALLAASVFGLVRAGNRPKADAAQPGSVAQQPTTQERPSAVPGMEQAPPRAESSDAVEAAKTKARFLADEAKWLAISVGYQEQRLTPVGPLPVRIGRRIRGTSNPARERSEIYEVPDNHPDKDWVCDGLDTLHFYTPVYDESLVKKYGLPQNNPLSYLGLRERISASKL